MKPHIKLLIGGIILICIAIVFALRGSYNTVEMGVQFMDIAESNKYLREKIIEKDATITVWKDSLHEVVIYFDNREVRTQKENAALKIENKFLKDARKKTRDSLDRVKRIRVYDILPK